MIDSFRGEYRFLSNFYPSEIEYEGRTYPTVEHAYQAAKTTDPEAREQIAAAATPGIAKRLGASVPLRPDWHKLKLSFMFAFVSRKFEDPELRRRLLSTGSECLREGNSWGDTFWGVDRDLGGKNHLGRLLMNVRASLTE